METHQRKSHTSINRKYFWTATIHKWLPLLENDFNKQLIVDSFKYLSDKELINVYAFVIMPNHIHLIWQQNGLNSKETTKREFIKAFSASIFKATKGKWHFKILRSK
jgi:putative transposase